MPLAITVGLSKKASQNYQSTGCSINVTAELDQSLLAKPDELQKQIGVKGLSGVYGLDMLRFLAGALDVKYRDAMGRGFEAQNIHAALHAHFKAADSPAKPA